jgi:hypothetical protein
MDQSRTFIFAKLELDRSYSTEEARSPTTWLPYTYFPDLNEDKIKKSVHDYVQQCGYQISHFITTYSAINIGKEDAEILNCKKGIAAMKIINRGILENDKLFEYSEMINLDYSCAYFTPFNPYSHQYRKN